MSSLQSIMNLDEDQQEPSGSVDKKVKDHPTPAPDLRCQDPSASTSSSRLSHTGQQYSFTAPSAPTISIPVTERSDVYYPSQQPTATDPSSTTSLGQGTRSTEPSSVTPTLLTASSAPGDLRRQSSTSVDSMDQYGGYASSSSMGGGSGGGFPPNHPRRPMGASPGPEVPVRYTPITGRVSRAKKGVPVHICESCNPPKTFTRAEHLRRHQLSHQQPRFPCDQCDRAFHRQDLLTRHQQRHNQEGGDQGSQSGNDAGGDSGASGASGPNRHLPHSTGYRGFGGPSTPSSMPGTPPAGGRSESMGSPQPGGAADAYEPSPDQSHNYTCTTYGLQDSSMESSPDPPTFSNIDYNMVPRTAPLPLFVATQGLAVSSSDHPPELIQSTDYSPWTSASESTYSTPGDHPTRLRPRHAPQNSLGWQTNPEFLSAFSNTARRSISTTEGHDTLATTQYYLSNAFPMSGHLAPVSHHSYNPLLSGIMNSGFANEQGQSLMGAAMASHHNVSHQRSSSVRSQTPEISIATSGQMADTLVTPASIPRRIDPMAHARQKELLVHDALQDGQMGVLGGDSNWNGDNPDDSGILTGVGLSNGCGGSGTPIPTPLPRSVRNSIPTYIDIYWERFHAFYPVVHRRAFEEQGEDVLRCAMAAIATQYINSKEDRIRGSQLHDFAWQEAKHCPQSNLQVMQAILLCELFARFRGRKAVVRPSKLFEHLYSRVLAQRHNLYNSEVPSNAAKFEHELAVGGTSMAKEEQWRTWIGNEGRRRLLTACFIVDSHASMMHQQPCARDGVDPSIIPLTGPSDALWSANSADEFFSMLHSNRAAAHGQFLPRLYSLCPEELAQYSVFDRSAILSAATLSMPRRNSQCGGKRDEQDSVFADDLRTPTNASYAAQTTKTKPEDRLLHLFSLSNAPTSHVYVALHHTPLHDLLAVSGESWVFTQKVLPAPTFHEHQKRLKAWVEGRSTTSPTSPTSPTTVGLEGMSCAQATIHSAHALLEYFGRNIEATNGVTPYVTCVSDYWAIYVCALIVWAFGHKAGKPVSAGSSGSPPTSRGRPMNEDEAVAWLHMVADSGVPEHIGRVKGRREASAAVVSMVKRRLELDCVGGRSRLFVDAVGVLQKLEEGVNWRWF